MKPIRLEIDGINSYSIKQVIDFEYLVSRGIFGIFGKTGSGKSTILDAITLALYGNIARGTKEFVNSSCDKGLVDYEFEIGEGSDRARYRITRRFKKKISDGKTSSRSDYVKLLKKNELGEYDVIADKVNDANIKIREILGLEESDFLKSVVLPQGKFSEFLTLTGKDRRNMLERIFNLEEYGSLLSIKISREKSAINSEIDILNARLSEHSNASVERKNELEDEISNLDSQIKDKTLEIERLKTSLDENKAIFELCEENKILIEKLEELNSKKDDMDNKKTGLEKSKNANIISANIESYNKNLNRISENNKKTDEILSTYSKKEKELEIEKLNYELSRLEKRLESEKNEIIDLKKLKKQAQQISELNKVDKIYREAYNSSVSANNEIARMENEKSKLEEKIASEKEEILLLTRKIETLEGKLLKKDEEIGNIIESINREERIKTFSEDDFSKLDIEIDRLKEIYSNIGNNKAKIVKLESELNEIKSTVDKFEENKKNLSMECDEVSKNLVAYKEKSDHINMENLSAKIRKDWSHTFSSGDRCPVCDSIVEDLAKLDIEEFDNEYEALIEKLNVEKDKLSKSINETEAKCEVYKKQEDDLNKELVEIQKFLKEQNSEDLAVKIEELGKLKKEQRALKESVAENTSKLKDEQRKADIDRTTLYKDIDGLKEVEKLKSSQILEFEKDIKDICDKVVDLKEQLRKTMEDFSIESIEDTGKDINKKDEIVEAQSKIAYDIEKVIEEKNTILENIANKNSEIKEVIESIKELIRDKETSLSELKLEKRLLEYQVSSEKGHIDEFLIKNKFVSMDEVNDFLLSSEELNNLEVEIKEFEKSLIEQNAKLIENTKKLDGRKVTEEEITQHKFEFEEKNSILENMKKEMAGLNVVLIEVKKSLDIVKDIVENLAIKQREKDNVDQLDKVMRGNKFVEYLSQIYLNNIVKDASMRLDSITNGRYSIEIDSEYSFVIRDNFNGGIRRSADTLSGGETFLTSLSLALALSSQIQLKGSCPLEFFFLDEGFGTLDGELLDTVMESLEKLKSNTLSVGVISHMDEMRNRIPMKLVVEMDESKNSSIARIELT